MKTLKKCLAGSLLSLCFLASKAQTGEIRGYIKNEGKEAVMFATVKILQGNQLMGGSETDENGKYSVKPLVPGTYEMIVLHPELQTQKINKIVVTPNHTEYVNITMLANTLGTVTVVAKAYDYTGTGVDIDVFHTKSIGGADLMQNASYERGNIKDALTFMTSEVVQSNDGQLHVRGARGGATGYFIDGVRTLEPTTIPGLGIENISAFTGGMPAMYGDLISGAVIVTTRTYFSGIRDKNVRRAIAEDKKKEATAVDED